MTTKTGTSDSLPARVALASDTAPTGQFDGAWWPRSRVFPTEAPPLLTAVQRLGHFTRAVVDLQLWPGPLGPFEVPGLGRTMHWGWFASGEDPHRIMLYSIESRGELLVVPPQTDPAAAALLMTAACDANETRSATQLIHEIAGWTSDRSADANR
jgi:hypothetical protein